MVFTSAFWKELFKLMGTSLDMSTSYHSQLDGKTERLNQCLENYLRCMVHNHRNWWHKWLPLAEFWYNTNFYTFLKMTHFQVLYGYASNYHTLRPYLPSTNAMAKNVVLERLKMQQVLRDNLRKAQHRMCRYANKHRQEMVFEVGDQVYLKLQPFKHSSVHLRKNLKLSLKYYGPFTIVKKLERLPIN